MHILSTNFDSKWRKRNRPPKMFFPFLKTQSSISQRQVHFHQFGSCSFSKYPGGSVLLDILKLIPGFETRLFPVLYKNIYPSLFGLLSSLSPLSLLSLSLHVFFSLHCLCYTFSLMLHLLSCYRLLTIFLPKNIHPVLTINFMLPVPEASVPAREICSDRSAAGITTTNKVNGY